MNTYALGISKIGILFVLKILRVISFPIILWIHTYLSILYDMPLNIFQLSSLVTIRLALMYLKTWLKSLQKPFPMKLISKFLKPITNIKLMRLRARL